MKSMMMGLVAVFCLLPGVVSAETPDRWVNSERLDRHSCPDTRCGRVGTLFFREGVKRHEEKGEWVRISPYYDAGCRAGMTAYVQGGDTSCTVKNGIKNGKLAEWVQKKSLSVKQPANPAASATGNYTLIKDSDDYKKYKDIFAKTAQELVASGQCSEADFQQSGGFLKSTTTYKDKPVYFTYCGGMTIANRLYLDAKTGKVFR